MFPRLWSLIFCRLRVSFYQVQFLMSLCQYHPSLQPPCKPATSMAGSWSNRTSITAINHSTGTGCSIRPDLAIPMEIFGSETKSSICWHQMPTGCWEWKFNRSTPWSGSTQNILQFWFPARTISIVCRFRVTRGMQATLSTMCYSPRGLQMGINLPPMILTMMNWHREIVLGHADGGSIHAACQCWTVWETVGEHWKPWTTYPHGT